MKNTIIYWKGGGYDGCIWEPNMGFFDDNGEWHPVISTGCGALDTKGDVEAEMRKQEDPNVPDYEKTDLLMFPIEGEHPLEWMCEHVRIDYVAVLADALVEAGYSVDMKCDCCGKWFSSDDYKFGDIVGIMSDSGFYKGDGGVGVIVTDVWCDECRQDTECPQCCQLTRHPSSEGDAAYDHMTFREAFIVQWLGVCEYCADSFFREDEYRHWSDEMDGLEETIDNAKEQIDKYIKIMREGGRSEKDLAELEGRNRTQCEETWRELVNELRDRMQSDVEEYFRDANDFAGDRLAKGEHYVW